MALHEGDAGKQSALLVKLGILYTEKVNAPDKATTAWQALLASEPDNRRAQDALKKLYLQQRDWNALEQFYAAQGKWDELVRVLERQSETEEDGARLGLWNKIGEIYRDRLAKPDRAQKAFEKALALDAQNVIAAEALIPIYEKANAVGALAQVLSVQLQNTRVFEDRQARMKRLAGLLDGEAGDRASALQIALTAFSENPASDWAREDSARLAAASGGWANLVEVYEAALSKIKDANIRLSVLGILAGAYEKVSPWNILRLSSATSRFWKSRPRTKRPSAPWNASTSPPDNSHSFWPSTTRSSNSRSPRRISWTFVSSWPASTRTKSSSPTGRLRSTRRS